jgi:hypothetical protein
LRTNDLVFLCVFFTTTKNSISVRVWCCVMTSEIITMVNSYVMMKCKSFLAHLTQRLMWTFAIIWMWHGLPVVFQLISSTGYGFWVKLDCYKTGEAVRLVYLLLSYHAVSSVLVKQEDLSTRCCRIMLCPV